VRLRISDSPDIRKQSCQSRLITDSDDDQFIDLVASTDDDDEDKDEDNLLPIMILLTATLNRYTSREVAGLVQLGLDSGMLFSTLSERRDVRSQVWVGWGEGVVNTET
jgi:hypothetical protein